MTPMPLSLVDAFTDSVFSATRSDRVMIGGEARSYMQGTIFLP